MKILIVDDDIRRFHRVSTFINKELSEQVEISHEVSSLNALTKLKQKYYDILIIDIVIPKRIDEHPNWKHGVDLLRHCHESQRIKIPSRIIGITAFVLDIKRFKAEFEKYCLTVIEVKQQSDEWKPIFTRVLNQTSQSQVAQIVDEKQFNVITIHGIRTFGNWQEALISSVSKLTDKVDFHTYKYGYFSTILFVAPYFRRKEIERLASAFRKLQPSLVGTKVSIFSHSFGTLLTAEALRLLKEQSVKIPIDNVVLSGSVLSQHYDWSYLEYFGSVRIINDCGTKDVTLWLSEIFVPKTGMAGKLGFYGFNNDKKINRYFSGGHSLFFEKPDFIDNYWTPILLGKTLKFVDERKSNFLVNDVIEPTILALGKFKFLKLALLSIMLISILYFI